MKGLFALLGIFIIPLYGQEIIQQRPIIPAGQLKILERVDFWELPSIKTEVAIAKDRRIAQIERKKGMCYLYLISKGAKRLIAQAQRIYHPVFSPDGSKMAYGFRTERKAKGQIGIVDLQTGKKRIIHQEGKNVGWVSLSSSGDSVAYGVESKEAEFKRRKYHIEICPTWEDNPWVVLKGNVPIWSPKSDKIAYTRIEYEGIRGVPYIWVYDLKTKRSLKLKNSKGGGGMDLRWSPTGEKIADSIEGIIIFDLESGDTVRIGKFEDHSPTWSPDGSKLAFVRPYLTEKGELLNEDIFVVNEDGSDLRNLTTTPDVIENRPIWLSPNEILVRAESRKGIQIEILKLNQWKRR